jgi:RHS repeat-associated protein
VTYQYDAAGRRTARGAPGQVPVSYAYDAASRLTQLTQGSQVATLAYDLAGRRTQLGLPNGVTTEYQYDAASRLTALLYRNALGPLGDLTYSYDAAGNRTGVGGSFARTLAPDAVTGATYDAANRLLTFGSQTATADANGNLATLTDASGVTTYTWDARDRLVGLSGPGLTANFTYDALGRRLAKTVNGETTQYAYDGLDVTQELGAGGPVDSLGTLSIDEPLVRGSSEFFLADALGSVVALTDATGTLGTEYTYEPFGRTVAAGVASTNPFQYTGREHDATGLYYYRARYYHPGLQRFVSEDPLGLTTGDTNLYAYARNAPTTFNDPGGLSPTTIIGAQIGAALGPAGVVLGGIAGLTIGVTLGLSVIDAITSSGKCDAPCPPCRLADGTVVPVGTIAYRLDAPPPGRVQHGIEGPHLNLYRANQAPRNSPRPCWCFWQPLRAVAAPPQPGWIPIQPFANPP